MNLKVRPKCLFRHNYGSSRLSVWCVNSSPSVWISTFVCWSKLASCLASTSAALTRSSWAARCKGVSPLCNTNSAAVITADADQKRFQMWPKKVKELKSGVAVWPWWHCWRELLYSAAGWPSQRAPPGLPDAGGWLPAWSERWSLLHTAAATERCLSDSFWLRCGEECSHSGQK